MKEENLEVRSDITNHFENLAQHIEPCQDNVDTLNCSSNNCKIAQVLKNFYLLISVILHIVK